MKEDKDWLNSTTGILCTIFLAYIVWFGAKLFLRTGEIIIDLNWNGIQNYLTK